MDQLCLTKYRVVEALGLYDNWKILSTKHGSDRCIARANNEYGQQRRGAKPWHERVDDATLERIRTLIHGHFFALGLPPTLAAINALLREHFDHDEYAFTSVHVLRKVSCR